MNKIMLIGNLTRDPELRSTASGVTVCSFTIAVNRRFAQQGAGMARRNLSPPHQVEHRVREV